MAETLVTAAAWLAVLAIATSAVLFGQLARFPEQPHRARGQRRAAARNRRIGMALSISGPIAVVILAIGVATMTAAWRTVAVVAFAAVAVVTLAGLVLAPD